MADRPHELNERTIDVKRAVSREVSYLLHIGCKKKHTRFSNVTVRDVHGRILIDVVNK